MKYEVKYTIRNLIKKVFSLPVFQPSGASLRHSGIWPVFSFLFSRKMLNFPKENSPGSFFV